MRERRIQSNTLKNDIVGLNALCLLLWALGPGTLTRAEAQEAFLRGDVNADGQVSVSDAVMLQNWLFNGGTPPACLDSADVYAPRDQLYRDDGIVDINDEIMLLLRLFPPASLIEHLGGDTSLPPPFPAAGPDPSPDDLPCESYDVIPPLETDDVVRFEDVRASPGETVRIPVYVSNHVPIAAYQLVASYDPGVLEIARVDGFVHEESRLHWSGGFYESNVPVGGEFFSIIPFPDQGMFVLSFVPYVANDPPTLPPGEEQLVFYILATISPTASPGTIASVEPVDGLDGEGFSPPYSPGLKLRNELSSKGEARYVSIEPRLEGAILRVVVDQMFFRGDSNSDGKVDISDAQHILNHLFAGGPPPACADAADSNDDGIIDISDPISTLQFLFLGGTSLPPPYPSAGRDPTDDDLVCEPADPAAEGR